MGLQAQGKDPNTLEYCADSWVAEIDALLWPHTTIPARIWATTGHSKLDSKRGGRLTGRKYTFTLQLIITESRNADIVFSVFVICVSALFANLSFCLSVHHNVDIVFFLF